MWMAVCVCSVTGPVRIRDVPFASAMKMMSWGGRGQRSEWEHRYNTRFQHVRWRSEVRRGQQVSPGPAGTRPHSRCVGCFSATSQQLQYQFYLHKHLKHTWSCDYWTEAAFSLYRLTCYIHVTCCNKLTSSLYVSVPVLWTNSKWFMSIWVCSDIMNNLKYTFPWFLSLLRSLLWDSGWCKWCNVAMETETFSWSQTRFLYKSFRCNHFFNTCLLTMEAY